jgi:hypothetical protein
MSRNSERAERARVALDALQTDGDGEDAIVDLIADLLHYSRERALDPERVAQRALSTWLAEDLDPKGDGRRYLGYLARIKAHASWYVLAAATVALGIDELVEQFAAFQAAFH